MTMRLSINSLAGTARTEVAVGTSSEASMFDATAFAGPRSWISSGPSAAAFAGAAGAAAFGAGGAAGAAASGAGAAAGCAGAGAAAGAAGAGAAGAAAAGAATGAGWEPTGVAAWVTGVTSVPGL